MHDFCYVSKREVAPIKAELIDLIHRVQDYVRDDFTFQYYFVGSSSRNMITYDRKSNVGFDFDVNIVVNDDDEQYSPKEIRTSIREAFNRFVREYGYDYCEDSTSVLTIKKKSVLQSKIIHSCDIAIVYDCNDGRQQYIRFNKDKQNYTWEYRGGGFEFLPSKISWLKSNNLWGELLDYYIYKKNVNDNPEKHSRSLFAESVAEVCRKNGYR